MIFGAAGSLGGKLSELEKALPVLRIAAFPSHCLPCSHILRMCPVLNLRGVGVQEAPGLLQTIEDFMWFKLALVRPGRGETATSSGYFASGGPPPPRPQMHLLYIKYNTPLRSHTDLLRYPCPSCMCSSERCCCNLAGAGESWAYTLADLQAYLGQFPAAHYSHGGREPLLYCTVLLLSLQFRAAVAFLAQDASARDYRVDAPHLAIALTHQQVIWPLYSGGF